MPRKLRPPTQDRVAVFDALLSSGRLTLPKGLSPETARSFTIENPPREWTKKDEREWQAARLACWRRRKGDPHLKRLSGLIRKAIEGAGAFNELDVMPKLCAWDLVHEKVIEVLSDALDGLLKNQKRREETKRKQRFAESEVKDANSRMGLWPEIFKIRRAQALKMLAEIQRTKDNDHYVHMDPKGLMDDLTLNLFAVVRHVTPTSGLDRVSDKRIHRQAIKPILEAFTKADNVIPKRIEAHSGEPQVAPGIRLKRHLGSEQRHTKVIAELWSNSGLALDSLGLVLQARFLQFSWDTRFKPTLFQNR
jgi:hypothetical protein